MKKYIIILLISFLLIPIKLNAAIYVDFNESVAFTNEYSKSLYDYELYFVTNKEFNKFVFDNNGISKHSSFQNAGFLNKLEYEIAGGENSYFYDGAEHWLMPTTSTTSTYKISPTHENKLYLNDNNEKSGVRTTNYVLSHIKVTGRGTYVNPWVFVDEIKKYDVLIKLDGEEITYSIERDKPLNEEIYVNEKRTLVDAKINCGDSYYTSKVMDNGKYIIMNIPYVSKNITCTITSNPRAYDIALNPNGGNLTQTSYTVTYKEPYGALPRPTKSGYTFQGWYTAATGGTLISSSTIVTDTKTHTLYAHWSPSVYTISFNANGGSVSTSSKNVTYGSTYGTLPTPTRQHFDFVGWYTSASGGTKITSNTQVTITSNQTLYAHWQEVTPPTLAGGSSSWTKNNITISISSAGNAYSGIKTYHYYLGTETPSYTTTPTGTSFSSYTQTTTTTSALNLYVRTVSNQGIISKWSTAQTIKVDKTVPTITIKKNSSNAYTFYDLDNSSLVYTVDWKNAPSGNSGTVSCTNASRSNSVATNYNNLALGLNTVTCTATNKVGATNSDKQTIKMHHDYTVGKILTQGCTKNTSSEKVLCNSSNTNATGHGRQYGPYKPANVGKFSVTYTGTNLNLGLVQSYYNLGQTDISFTTTKNTSDTYSYTICLKQNINNIETSLTNKTTVSNNTLIKIKKIEFRYIEPC